MEFISQYLLKLIASAFICSIALMLSPKGKTQKAVAFVCAAVMLSAALSPISELDFSEYSRALTQYKLKAAELSEEGQEDSKNLSRTYIQDRCSAYILDKAKSMGISVTEVKVHAEWSKEGFWYPIEVELKGTYNAALSSYIESELGIARKMQSWT